MHSLSVQNQLELIHQFSLGGCIVQGFLGFVIKQIIFNRYTDATENGLAEFICNSQLIAVCYQINNRTRTCMR